MQSGQPAAAFQGGQSSTASVAPSAPVRRASCSLSLVWPWPHQPKPTAQSRPLSAGRSATSATSSFPPCATADRPRRYSVYTVLRRVLTGTVVAGLALGASPGATATASPSQLAAARSKVFLPSDRGHIFTVPNGVTTVTIDVVGGGAGGGAGSETSYAGGQGGGAGAIVRCTVPVPPKTRMYITPGRGGVGGGFAPGSALAPGGLASSSDVIPTSGGGRGNPAAFSVGAAAGGPGHSGYEREDGYNGKGGATAACNVRGQRVAPASFAAGGDGQEGRDVYGGAGGQTGALPAGCPKGSGAGGKGGPSAKKREQAKGHRGGNGCIVLRW